MSRAPKRPNPRARLRRVLLLAGILPALLVLAYTAKVAWMVHGNGEGRDAFERGDNDGAAMAFADTRRWNWFESWVAPFDEGTGHHADGVWDRAMGAYEDALESVPDDEECTVRINLALVHEALGDEAQAERDFPTAGEEWQQGIDVLAAADCPTDAGRGEEQTADAAAVDERLRNKVQQNEQQQQQDPQPQDPQQPQDPGQDDPQGGEDPRPEQLERNNRRGLEQKHEDEELYGDGGYGRTESW